ncbi:non-ribosomal peptide synthetase [Streptomyces sp. NPDC001985]|uniref:non-ribosomal peptide synthetase n=1 Tax=Streptomyces sp. NPDC001985 TaxID=3154406 RepID=UPI003331A0CE
MTDGPVPGSAGTPEREPASAEQRGLLLVEELHPGTPAYNIPAVFRMLGELDVPALEYAIGELIARHESLRTTFVWDDGTLHQRIAPPGAPGSRAVPLSATAGDHDGLDPAGFAAAEATRPIDPYTGPPLRARLLRGPSAREHTLSLVFHHAVVDGWSLRLLLAELSALYTARTTDTAPPPPGPGRYRDYAAHQRGDAWAKDRSAALDHWRRALADPPAPVELPADRPRPAIQDLSGAVLHRTLDTGLGAAVRARATGLGTTPYVVLLTAWCVLAGRLGGATDLLVGSPFAGRARPEDEQVAGCFVNTLALRADLSGDPGFAELTGRLRATVLGAFDHHRLPFDRLVGELVREHDPGRPPLVQTTFGVERAGAGLDLPGLTVHEEFAHNGCAKFDLSLLVVESGGRFTVRAEYATALYDPATVERLVDHYLTLLAAALRAPDTPIGALPLTTPEETARLIALGRGPDAGDSGDRCVDEIFTALARRAPGAIALVHGDEEITYRRLDRRSNALARVLREHGVTTETPVGVLLDRTPDLITALLAIWKAGGAYVPLDPDHPDDRLRLIADDTALPLLITDRDGVAERLGRPVRVLRAGGGRAEAGHGPPPAPGRTPRSLAYVIHTSGSTGRPKGALLEHAGLANLIAAQRLALGDLSRARVLQFSRPTFDASVWEIVMALGHGGALRLPADGAPLSGGALADELRRGRVTHATVPPSVLASLPPGADPGAVTLISAGEELPARLAARLAARGPLFNGYGPTEATVAASLGEIRGTPRRPAIGTPVGNAEALVLDAALRPVPPGVTGELHIGGAGLARGYLGRPGLTAERFIPHPWAARPGQRLYRTGDLARLLPDGRLEFLGRVDRQVKIRGFRIEPGEVEEALRLHPDVANAVVTVSRDDHPAPDGRHERDGQPPERERRLIAHAAPLPGRVLRPDSLAAFLRTRLPAYMVPAVFVIMDAIPVNSSGKADHTALPQPGRERPDTGHAYIAPADDTERDLVRMWSEILGLDRVGVTDSFLALGGSSLEMVRLRDRIQQDRRIRVPMAELFRAHNIRLLAAHLAEREGEPVPPAPSDLSDQRRARAARLSARTGRTRRDH